MKENDKAIVLACLFAVFGIGTAFIPYVPLRNICYFLTWIICLVYFVLGLLLVIGSISRGPGFVEAAREWKPSRFQNFASLLCVIGIISVVMAGKFVLGMLCVIDLICICIFVATINEYRKKEGLS